MLLLHFSCLWAFKSIVNTKTQNSEAVPFTGPLLEFIHLSLMLKFNVKYLKELLLCFWSIYKPLAWEVSRAETINSATHLWWKAWPAIYSEFRIPLQLSAFCLTNVTVWHEIAPKSSFMVLFGTTYEETRGGHKRMKHSASEKNSGHVCALSGKPLWSRSLSKGHWRMNKLLKHIIPLFRSTPCKPGPWCLFFF